MNLHEILHVNKKLFSIHVVGKKIYIKIKKNDYNNLYLLFKNI